MDHRGQREDCGRHNFAHTHPPPHDRHSLLSLLRMSHYIARVRNFKIGGLLYIIHVGPNVVHMGPLK